MTGIARFVVGDQSGRILNELEPSVQPVSWRLNDFGRCQFSLALTDPKAVEGNLRYSNRVLIQFSNGLPAWGGVIDPPRTWQGGVVTCTAYSGEYILGLRQTDKGRYFSGATVGSIFQAIIGEASAVQPLGVELGNVWNAGALHSPDYHFAYLLDIIQDSICTRLSDSDFDVTASEVNGKIMFTANLYVSRGTIKNKVALIEGHNLTDDTKLNEQGPIVNWWDMAGSGNSWGDDRLLSNAVDPASQALFGLRQGSKVYSDVAAQTTLDAHSVNALAQSKDPHKIIELTAQNVGPAGFADYDVGDSVRVTLPSFGFGGLNESVRILAREFDPATGVCGLVVRVNE